MMMMMMRTFWDDDLPAAGKTVTVFVEQTEQFRNISDISDSGPEVSL